MRFSPWLQNECMRALYRRIFFPLTEENTDKFLFFVRVPFSLWKPIGSSREIELRKSLNADEKFGQKFVTLGLTIRKNSHILANGDGAWRSW